MNKGISTLATVAMWAIGLMVPISLAWNNSNTTVNSAQDQKIYDLNGRVSSLESDTKRIPIVEAKIDAILEKQGVNPSAVELRAQRQIDIASTSQARR